MQYIHKGFTVKCFSTYTYVTLNEKYLNNNSMLIDEPYEFEDYIDAEKAIDNFN
jgi:hypothetical protein